MFIVYVKGSYMLGSTVAMANSVCWYGHMFEGGWSSSRDGGEYEH